MAESRESAAAVSADSEQEAFYVGYEAKAPGPLGRFLRRWVLLLLLLAGGLAALLVSSQAPFDHSYFEFGTMRTFNGVVYEQPAPRLVPQLPEAQAAASTALASVGERESYLLVAPGKFGAQELVAGMDGQAVTMQGTLIYRDGQTMIEVVPDSLERANSPTVADSASRTLGRMRLSGEIVDSKCYYGVMKPGHGKPHRSCAVRCISGGIPPVLVLHGTQGPGAFVLLVGADGEAIGPQLLDLVGQPVSVEGEVEEQDGLLILRAPVGSFALET